MACLKVFSMMKMDFLPNLALKISALTLAVAITASCTTMATGTDYQTSNTQITSNATSSTALAIGNKSMAGGMNSIAIGNEAKTTKNNQIVLGNAGQVQSSTASQSGTVRIVTIDDNGTLGTMLVDYYKKSAR